MSEVISNPTQTVKYDMSFNDLKEHFKEVVSLFPKEYKIISEDQSFRILVLSRYKQFENVPGDVIINAVGGDSYNVEYLVTNETGEVKSHTEKERGEYTLMLFTKLIAKSVAGTLRPQLNANKKAGEQKLESEISGLKNQQTMNYIMIAVAIIVIIVALKAFMH